MQINDSCAKCLYDRQVQRTNDETYLAEIRKVLDERAADDCGPLLVYKFNRIYEKHFGKKPAMFTEEKKQFNDLVMSMERELEAKIEASEDPLMTSLLYARIGNYIDFGAMHTVDKDEFLAQFSSAQFSEADMRTYRSFLSECEKARNFLLLADNCGEIVLDKLLIRQLKKRFPQLSVSVMVRGGEALNDATAEDAVYVGIDREARVIPNGSTAAGTIESLISAEAREALDTADVILSKGNGNYESLAHRGRHIFYAFLCKCELFIKRFNVPRLTGIFIEEK